MSALGVWFLSDQLFSPTDAWNKPETVKRRVGTGLLGLKWFNGMHNQANIASYSGLLGLVGGLGLWIGLSGRLQGLGFYMACLAVFHTMEYLTTAMFKSNASLTCKVYSCSVSIESQ